MMFWACYLMFTGCSSYDMFVPRGNGPAKIFKNTFIAAAASGLFSFVVKPLVLRTSKHVSFYDCLGLCNGIIAGLVSISGSVSNVEPWAAFCIGIIGAILYIIFCKYLEVRQIDDPIEGSAVHMVCGAWGLMARGFFDN